MKYKPQNIHTFFSIITKLFIVARSYSIDTKYSIDAGKQVYKIGSCKIVFDLLNSDEVLISDPMKLLDLLEKYKFRITRKREELDEIFNFKKAVFNHESKSSLSRFL